MLQYTSHQYENGWVPRKLKHHESIRHAKNRRNKKETPKPADSAAYNKGRRARLSVIESTATSLNYSVKLWKRRLPSYRFLRCSLIVLISQISRDYPVCWLLGCTGLVGGRAKSAKQNELIPRISLSSLYLSVLCHLKYFDSCYNLFLLFLLQIILTVRTGGRLTCIMRSYLLVAFCVNTRLH